MLHCFLSSEQAKQLDGELMNLEKGGFTLVQLIELAGLGVAQVVHDAYPSAKRILVIVGVGNNGSDGMVAARHLALYGYQVEVVCPKVRESELSQRLLNQCLSMGIAVYENMQTASMEMCDIVIDAIFGFGFDSRRPLGEPFLSILQSLSCTGKPIVSVDVPSGWDVDHGPPRASPHIKPTILISLTWPKPCAKEFLGEKHYLTGRFVPPPIARKYGLDLSKYGGASLFCRL